MLAISTSAAEAIADLTEAQRLPEDSGMRISADPDRGGQLRLYFVDGPSKTDHVVEERGAHVFVDADVAPMLDDKVLVANLEGGTLRFTVLEGDG
jgi:iron-sulfur cluster assembly protein